MNSTINRRQPPQRMAPQSQAVAHAASQDSDELTAQETLLLMCGFAAILASAASWILL